MDNIDIFRDSSGVLKVRVHNTDYEFMVRPIRCFPLTEADRSLALVKIEEDGTLKEEIAFISDYKQLDENSRRLIEEELDRVYPLTHITKINSIKQTKGKLEWHVDTNKGTLVFEVRDQKDVHMIQSSLIVMNDNQGNRFFVNPAELDTKSKILLEVYI